MVYIMEIISKFLSCNLKTYTKPDEKKILSLSGESRDKIKFLIDSFNKYPLLGVKFENFKDGIKVYVLIIDKEHLTKEGKVIIKDIQSNMNSKRTSYRFES